MHLFDEIYHTFKADVYSLLSHLTRDVHAAEELTQETFIRVYKYLPTYRGDSALKTWLIRIAYNIYFTWRKGHHHSYPLDNAVASSTDPIDAVNQRIDLRSLLDNLTDSEKTLIVLRDINDLTYQDIAAVMGINIGQVRVGLHRARKRLRDQFKGGSK